MKKVLTKSFLRVKLAIDYEFGRRGYRRDMDRCREIVETQSIGLNRLYRFKVQHNAISPPDEAKTQTNVYEHIAAFVYSLPNVRRL